jgi:hypothetical protein
MGAGGGQSILGALSTETHGSDVQLSPLCDYVRAIHLVGPGGQEWWVEPAESRIRLTDQASLLALPDKPYDDRAELLALSRKHVYKLCKKGRIERSRVVA